MNGILDRLGLTSVINATGTVTRLGASRMAPEVVAAMAEAADRSIDMADLQGRASDIIAGCTGAEAGIVTAGAAAGLLVGAASCMTGLDPVKMARLPDTDGMRNEFLVARSHRNSYDHAVRAAGARFIEVGLSDRRTGCGVRDTEVWEIEAAISDRTAGILYLAAADARPSLAAVVRAAHRAKVPVLVDAAAQLPPAANLRRFIGEGADLVVFSGGKGIGGPSASGILCGRRALVGAALLQQLDLDYLFEDWSPPSNLVDKRSLPGVPRHGIGRGCKVGKEQIVGLLVALQRFAVEDDAARNQRFAAIVDALVAAVARVPALRVRAVADLGHGGMPLAEVIVEPGLGFTAAQVAAALRASSPSIEVDATEADIGRLMLAPTCLSTEDAALIGAAFARAVARPA